MSNFEKFSKFVIEMIRNGDDKTQEALHDAIDLAINVILNSVSAWASELDDKQLSRENKIHLVSKLTADIDGFIMPLHKMIEGIDLEDERAKFLFNLKDAHTHIATSTIGTKVRKYTFQDLGETVYFKAIVLDMAKRGKTKELMTLSKRRGTDVQTIIDTYLKE